MFQFHLCNDGRMICRGDGTMCSWTSDGWRHSRISGHRQEEADQSWGPKMTLSEAISCCENPINFLKQRSITLQMNRLKEKCGKKGGGKASRWHRQMSPKELTHNFSFSFYSSCWQVLLQFYEDFLINKNFKKYGMMLCFLHFKERKRHIKFISLLWRLRSRIYSIEFKLTKYLHLGIEWVFFFLFLS